MELKLDGHSSQMRTMQSGGTNLTFLLEITSLVQIKLIEEKRKSNKKFSERDCLELILKYIIREFYPYSNCLSKSRPNPQPNWVTNLIKERYLP